jgi:hypothetical protein
MFIFNLAAYAFLPAMVRATQQAATSETRALSLGITSSAASILALGVGLPTIGLISDVLTPAHGHQAIGYALALVSSVGLLGALAFARAQRALETRRRAEHQGAPGPILEPKSARS